MVGNFLIGLNGLFAGINFTFFVLTGQLSNLSMAALNTVTAIIVYYSFKDNK